MSTDYVQHTTIRFEQLMDAVRKAIREVVGNDPDPELLSKIEALTDIVIQNIEAEGFTHPPKTLADLRQAFDTLKQAPQQLAAHTPHTGELELLYLLMCYRDYLTLTKGADEAGRCLSELFGVFHRKPGRPAELLVATVMKAKKLWDAGRSYAEIGILLNLGRQRVRSALRHHYPEKKLG